MSLPRRGACHREDRFRVVIRRSINRPLEAAFRACVDDTRLRGGPLDADGFHHAAAHLLPIPWIHIDMLAPKALQAVVGVAIPFHLGLAMPTYKVFFRTFETHSASRLAPLEA